MAWPGKCNKFEVVGSLATVQSREIWSKVTDLEE